MLCNAAHSIPPREPPRKRRVLGSDLIHDGEPMRPRGSGAQGENTSATRADPLRSSTRTPGTSRRGTAFDVGQTILARNRVLRNAMCRRKARESLVPRVARTQRQARHPFQADPQLQAEAGETFALEQMYTKLDPAVHGDWKTMEEVVRKYAGHIEGPPPAPFAPTPCDDSVGQSSAGDTGGTEEVPLALLPTLPVLNPDFWQSYHHADDERPAAPTAVPLDFAEVFSSIGSGFRMRSRVNLRALRSTSPSSPIRHLSAKRGVSRSWHPRPNSMTRPLRRSSRLPSSRKPTPSDWTPSWRPKARPRQRA